MSRMPNEASGAATTSPPASGGVRAAPPITTPVEPSDTELEALIEGIAEVSKHVRNILFALVTVVAFVLLAAVADRQITIERQAVESEVRALTAQLNKGQQ